LVDGLRLDINKLTTGIIETMVVAYQVLMHCVDALPFLGDR